MLQPFILVDGPQIDKKQYKNPGCADIDLINELYGKYLIALIGEYKCMY